MMTLFNCIESAINTYDENGERIMDAARGRQAQSLFNEFYEKYRGSMGDDVAARQAAIDTKAIMRRDTSAKRRAVAKDLNTKRTLFKQVTTHRNQKGELDPAEALTQLVQNTGTARFEDVVNTQKAIRRQLFFGLDDFFARHAKNLLGETKKKAKLVNVHKELMGEKTGDAASRAMAMALRDAFEQARIMFNAEGGNIPKLENWAPQMWRKSNFRQGGAEEFADLLMDRVDWEKMTDPLTGRPFGAGNGSREFLIAAFDSIRTGGANKIDPSLGRTGKSLANQRSEMRQIHFKSADDWMVVAERYGSPDLFDATVGYLEMMSRDIARLRALGRNPDAGLDFAIQVAKEQASKMDDRALVRVEREAKRAKNALANYSGDLSVAQSEFMANFFSGVRNTLAAAHLGSAVISSVTDAVTLGAASRHLGIPARRTFARSIRNLTDGMSKEDMKRMVGVLETAMETSAAMTKFMGEVSGPEVTRRMASFVIRAQGLAHMTDINRASFQMEVMGLLAGQKDVAFGGLKRELREAMELSGITEADWDTLRSGDLFEGNSGGTFMVIRDVLDRADLSPQRRQELFTKFQSMIERETEFAIPSRDLLWESDALVGTNRGTIPGEILRGGLQYRGFAISLTANMVRRFHSMPTAGGKVGYIFSMVAGLTVMGALAIQLKNLVRGKEAFSEDEMMSDEFWARAMFQGGGLGIFGDFIQSETNRRGGGLAETFLGPQVGLASDAIQLTGGNVLQFVQGKDTRAGREFTKFVERNLPGSNLWMVRLAMERAVFDQIQGLLDPDANEDFGLQKRRARETGADYWWEPGDVLPQ